MRRDYVGSQKQANVRGGSGSIEAVADARDAHVDEVPDGAPQSAARVGEIGLAQEAEGELVGGRFHRIRRTRRQFGMKSILRTSGSSHPAPFAKIGPRSGTLIIVTLRSVVLLCALSALVACDAREPALVLATTTSVANSGLLHDVLASYAVDVRVSQVGSGRALALLASGEAVVAITHAPDQETAALRDHPEWFYRKILYNDFLIVGPPDDPARAAGLTDASEALQRIVRSGQRFISRGDESGTHERERQLWSAARISPRSSHLIVAGASMGQTLRVASETSSYTLTDRGTFQSLSASLDLRELVAGDPRLLNTYAVIADAPHSAGAQFARWLADGDGRRVLSKAVAAMGARAFVVWPEGRPGDRPDARPF